MIKSASKLARSWVAGLAPCDFTLITNTPALPAIGALGLFKKALLKAAPTNFGSFPIPGIMEYTAQPEYEKCVAISTKASIREMMLPGAIALITPVIVGFIFGPEVLGGLLAGVTVSGVLMGIFQSNAGGAWDNAKKSFEKGVMINGEMFYKKSEPHKASVTGDTVGDPFKDTSCLLYTSDAADE